MKRIFAILLVVSIMILTLTSCNTNTIEDLKAAKNEAAKNISNDTKSDITLNVYIVYDDTEVNTFSTQTVAREINKYTVSQFNTSLQIFYFTSSEYKISLQNNIDTNAERSNKNAADIILINTPAIYNEFSSSLVDLTSVLKSEKYAGLNLIVDDSLLSSAKDTYLRKTLVVPNNQIVGSYKYVRIKRIVAEGDLSLSLSMIKSFDSEEKLNTSTDATEETEAFTCLKDIFANNYDITHQSYDDNVKVFTGNYQDRLYWEENGYIVNVIEKPTSTYVDVESGAFAITVREELLTEEEIETIEKKKLTSDEENTAYQEIISAKKNERIDRCMEIIYAFSNDFYLHNLLLYGVKGINYSTFEDTNGNIFVNPVRTIVIDPEKESEKNPNEYKMNPLYTGDIFCSYFCDEFGYTPSIKYYGKLQNADAYAASN